MNIKDSNNTELLKNLVIASPCSVSWESMKGDDRKRLCGGCSRFVHNISDMTKQEAENFLSENGSSECMIFYRRFDGTILTDDCPVSLRRLRNTGRKLVKLVAAALSLLFSTAAAQAQSFGENATGFRSTGGTEKEAPPGYCYSPNPAGGGMILRPVDKKTVPSSVQPAKPAQVPLKTPSLRGRPAFVPDTGSQVGDEKGDCAPAPYVVRHPAPALQKPQGSKQAEAANAEPRPVLDRSAEIFYEKGRLAQGEGKKPLALFYYEQALSAFQNQSSRDPKFGAEIMRAISSVNADSK